MSNLLTLNIQTCLCLQLVCESFMDDLTADLLHVVHLGDGDLDHGHSDPSLLVDLLSAPLPSLTPKIPLEPRCRVATSRDTLNVHFCS